MPNTIFAAIGILLPWEHNRAPRAQVPSIMTGVRRGFEWGCRCAPRFSRANGSARQAFASGVRVVRLVRLVWRAGRGDRLERGGPAWFGEAFASPERGAFEATGRDPDKLALGPAAVRLCVSRGQPWIDTHGPHITAAVVRGAVAARW